MKNKNIIFPLLALSLVSLASCNFKDPTKDFIEEATSYFKKYEENHTEKESLFYYDGSSMRCCVYNIENNESNVEYLGLLNFNNLRFSESNEYFFDLANIDIKINIDENYNVTFDIPSLMTNGAFDAAKFLDTPPFVLMHQKGESYEAISGINKEGEILSSSNKETYDSLFYYLSDFKCNIGSGINVDYSGKYISLLKRDLLELLTSSLANMDISLINNLSAQLLKNYKVINKLSNNEDIPSILNIDGEKFGKEVVVGPMSFTPIFGKTLENGNKVSFLDGVKEVHINEGVKEISFFAFDNVKTIKNIYLPNSLEYALISSLSNLELDNLYVGNSIKSINFMDIGTGAIDALNLNYTSALGNTKIDANVVFEGYENPSMSNFPFNTMVFSDNIISNHVAISKNREIKEFLNLNEAFNEFNHVSTLYMFPRSNLKHIETGGLTSIKENQRLYIDGNNNSSFTYLDAKKKRNVDSFDSSSEFSFTTVKLTNNLEINGEVIIGGTIGKNGDLDSTITGSFAALDLNGFRLTIKNGGKLISYGLIFDSKANETIHGSINIENGGTLTTNFSVKGYYGKDVAKNKIENNQNPFSTYSLNDLRCDVYCLSGGILKGNLNYFDNENEIENIIVGTGGLFESSDNLININHKDGVTNINLLGNSKVNPINILGDINTSNFYFPIANKYTNIIAEELTINNNVYISGDGRLVVDKLNLNGILSVNEKTNISTFNNFYNENSINDGYLKINNSLNLINNAGVYGTIHTNNSYSNIKESLKKTRIKFNRQNEGTLDNNNATFINIVSHYHSLVLKSDMYEFFMDNDYTYKEIKNGKEGSLIRNDNENTILATYNTDINNYWYAYVEGEKIFTNVDLNTSLNSFSKESLNYVLINGYWMEEAVEDEYHTYTFNGLRYIRYDGQYKDGTLNSNLVFSTNDGLNYYYNVDYSCWNEVEYYEFNRVIKEVNNDTAYYLTGNGFVKVDTYDSYNHYFVLNSLNIIFVGTTGLATYSTNNQIVDKSDGQNYIYLDDEGWSFATVNPIGKAIYNNETYFYVNNSKWIKMHEYNKYNHNIEIIYLDAPFSYLGTSYKYALSEPVNTSENRYTNSIMFIDPDDTYSSINVSQVDYDEIWDSQVLQVVPEIYKPIINENNNFTMKRHFKGDDGKLHLFYKDPDSGIVSKKTFTFASGFIPEFPLSGVNTMAKYNFFKYEVIFEGENEVSTIYMSFDTIGGVSSGSEYLAITVFENHNVILETLS